MPWISCCCTQADAVLALPLRRLTSMEASKLLQEERELQQRSSSLKKLLGSNKAIRQMVIDEAHELTNTLGDERRTLVTSLARRLGMYNNMACTCDASEKRR